MKKILIMILLTIAISVVTIGQTKPLAFVGAKIYTAAGPIIIDGVLIVKNGKIIEIGSVDEISLPSDAKIINAKGKVITPGLVDTHTHIGLDWGFDADSPTQPAIRMLDAINPNHDTFNRARAGGITTVNIMNGSGHLMSGQTVYLKTKKVNDVADMLFCDDIQNGICGGMKMANGTNSMRKKPFPGTRGKSAALVRQLFYKAINYKDKIDAADGDASKMPPNDIGLNAVVEVLDGKRVVHYHTHRADDILTVLRLKKEFGFKLVLHHVSEGWKVADEIAKANVPCSVIIVDSPGGKLEAVDLRYGTARILKDAGVAVAMHTDDWITDSRLFLRSAALAMRAGLSEEDAIRSLTIEGAKMLELDNRIGSIEKGKDADFIVLSGYPFSTYTHVEQTWIDGEKVFDRSNENDRKFAVGGYNIYRSAGHTHNLEKE
ncbi:FIG01042321: hypothetical protein [hydrothermal vent metagenome]|uniref:Amidohydrolase-related domain-containing protein n=1 Tax=hydrothermal vent metagenome TaxID=652676 RepID=A0A3B1CX60_9ZZZZ